MDIQLVWWLLAVATAAIAATVLLVCVKLIHRVYLRWQGVRTAQYIAVLGELISREMLPEDPPGDWAHDPLFHDALVEYRLALVGSERGFVDSLVDHLGVLTVLRQRMRNRISSTKRLRAISSFVDLATVQCTPDLRVLLADPNLHVAVHAAKGLSRLRDVASVGAILDRAVEAPQWHRARFADSLAQFGPEVGPSVQAWVRRAITIEDPPVATVALAARVLGLVGDLDAETLLLELLSSDCVEWRITAASALGTACGEHAVGGLLVALADPEGSVRARSAASLGHLGDPGVVHSLRPLLSDPQWWVRQNAAEAIGALPGGTAILVDVLGGRDPYAADVALYSLTMNGAVEEAVRRTRQGVLNSVDADLLAIVGNLPTADDAIALDTVDTQAAAR